MFYVYYNYGSCNEGDHDCGLVQFATLIQAIDFIREKKDSSGYDGQFTLVKGEEIRT